MRHKFWLFRPLDKTSIGIVTSIYHGLGTSLRPCIVIKPNYGLNPKCYIGYPKLRKIYLNNDI